MAEETELMESLINDFGEFKQKQAKALDTVRLLAEKAVADQTFQEKQSEIKKWFDDLTAETKKINEELASKGATVKQMQDELQEFKSKGGRRLLIAEGGEDKVSTYSLIAEAFKEEFPKYSALVNEPEAAHKFKIKAVGTMTGSANLTGNVVASYSATPALRGRRKLHIRDLIDVVPSSTGIWKFYRQNAVAGEGSFDFQTTHGGIKNQLDYDFTEVTITVDYLAGFVRIAKQMLQDLPFMQSFVTSELVEDYLRSEDAKFFGALYTAATGNAGASVSTVTVEKIIDYIAAINEADYDANGVVVTNPVWAKILKTKPNDYSLPGGNAVAVTANGDIMIAGVPILRTVAANIGNNKMLIGDWTKAKIIQTEGLNVNMYEQDADNVQRNLITVKAEARVALAILRPDAFIYADAGTT